MKKLQTALALANAVMCAIVLLLLLADILFPDADIFLNEIVKVYLLATCLVSAVSGAMLYARQRRRRRYRRRARKG